MQVADRPKPGQDPEMCGIGLSLLLMIVYPQMRGEKWLAAAQASKKASAAAGLCQESDMEISSSPGVYERHRDPKMCSTSAAGQKAASDQPEQDQQECPPQNDQQQSTRVESKYALKPNKSPLKIAQRIYVRVCGEDAEKSGWRYAH